MARRLLIVTQVVDKNDPILGFFHAWIEAFAVHYAHVTVICLKEGRHNFPSNVHVRSLGKEKGRGRVTYLARFVRFIVQERNNYDDVFVHMNPIYVVLGGPLWRIWGKRIGLWYVHRSVDMKLRIALLLVHHIFTVAKNTFRIKSNKVHQMGHAIDLQEVQPHIPSDTLRVLILGRIAPVKDLVLSIEALAVLAKRKVNMSVDMVGLALPEHATYEHEVRNVANMRGFPIQFKGSVPHDELPALFASHDLLLNTSKTGGTDKAVFEALAAGLKVVTTNDGFDGLFGHPWYVTNRDPESIAEAISAVRTEDVSELQAKVREEHALPSTIQRVCKIFA